MNTSHTPGPWVVAYDRSVRPESDAWTTIAQQYNGRDGTILSKEKQSANALLIAAAPELLEALQEAMFYVPMETKARVLGDIAIDKALGYNKEKEYMP